MTQPDLFQTRRMKSEQLARELVNALRVGDWRKREVLAVSLRVSVRAIRDAASHAQGHIISGNKGLKLTLAATPEELSEAVGRARSQIREMTRRIAEVESVWHGRERRRA